jgi:hypothetical protein
MRVFLLRKVLLKASEDAPALWDVRLLRLVLDQSFKRPPYFLAGVLKALIFVKVSQLVGCFFIFVDLLFYLLLDYIDRTTVGSLKVRCLYLKQLLGHSNRSLLVRVLIWEPELNLYSTCRICLFLNLLFGKYLGTCITSPLIPGKF